MNLTKRIVMWGVAACGVLGIAYYATTSYVAGLAPQPSQITSSQKLGVVQSKAGTYAVHSTVAHGKSTRDGLYLAAEHPQGDQPLRLTVWERGNTTRELTVTMADSPMQKWSVRLPQGGVREITLIGKGTPRPTQEQIDNALAAVKAAETKFGRM